MGQKKFTKKPLPIWLLQTHASKPKCPSFPQYRCEFFFLIFSFSDLHFIQIMHHAE